MPTYSYRCTECDTAFDIHQAFSDDSLTVCPSCGGALRKVFSAVGVSFSGSGFYRNDSRAKPASGEGSSSSKPASTEKAASTTPAPAATPAAASAPSSPTAAPST